jgi:hypothetical protein
MIRATIDSSFRCIRSLRRASFRRRAKHAKPVARARRILGIDGLEARLVPSGASAFAEFRGMGPRIAAIRRNAPQTIRQETSYRSAPQLFDSLATQYANDLTAEDVDRMSEFGFSSVRLVIYPVKKGWEHYDRLIDRIWSENMTPILILFSEEVMDTPQERQRLVEIAAHGAQRWADGPVLWDVWNEPTSPRFWKNKATPQVFADFASKVIDAIESQAPDHKVMLPSIPRIDNANKAFLFGVFDSRPDLLDRIDYVAVHLYGPTNGRGPHDPETKVKSLAALKSEFGSRYGRNIPFVISEFGWHTRGGGSVQPKVAGEYSPRLFLISLPYEIPLVVHYQWRDAPEEVGVSEPGIQTIRYGRRPAFDTLRYMIEQLDGYAYVRNLSQGNVYALLFMNASSQEKVVAWTTSGGRSMTLRSKTFDGRPLSLSGIGTTPRYFEISTKTRLSPRWSDHSD